ncbi:leucyl aminopeptidase [Thalassobacillus devorans]|uniref:leucyl aminopeptidase n=1 Tax=Thalassobacillus devorans TaxID=279813 RepID=UPI00048F0195|nr:leucyl aminopeptidase [Thalassobacillus devorans]
MFSIRKTLWEEDEALVVGLFHENKNQQQIYQMLNDKFDEKLDTYVKSNDISNHYKAVSKILTYGKVPAKRIYFLGLGKKKELTNLTLKKAFGKLFQQLQKDGLTQAAIAFDSFAIGQFQEGETAEVLAEAMEMATYRFSHYKTSNYRSEKVIDDLTLITEQEEDRLLYSLKVGEAFGKGANTARYLVHLPANLLTSSDMAEFALTLADEHGFETEILEKEDMQRLGMGALLAVNQGSKEPPKMIVLKYHGLNEWKDVVGLVGKGITYDTGGYSIKSMTGMPGIKGDMGGAAAVLGAMDTIGRLKPQKNVVAVIPSTDNMISGSAFKPDDVITSLSGKTIEVLNTDAEGRLALADGITYAKHHRAGKLIDVATLTGGMVTALGEWMTGAMTNNQDFYDQVTRAADKAGEPMWLLPYNEDYQAQVRSSSIADLNNSPTRKAHPIMGGAFVAEFAEETPWVHIDIAGTSVAESGHDLGPKGPTGIMARTLANYIISE